MSENNMDGKFIGGGQLDFVVSEGEIYLHAGQLSALFDTVGITQGMKSILTNDQALSIGAQLLLGLGGQFSQLRSELLKREAEKSLQD